MRAGEIMLSIGEFSKICQVSTKTLRYYEEIGLLYPKYVNEHGYRYYDTSQLEKMLMIQRLKNYYFSLDEIKEIINSNEYLDDMILMKLNKVSMIFG